jgi:hypothetical protein
MLTTWGPGACWTQILQRITSFVSSQPDSVYTMSFGDICKFAVMFCLSELLDGSQISCNPQEVFIPNRNVLSQVPVEAPMINTGRVKT